MTMRTSLTILAGIIAIQACSGAGDSAAGDTTPAESAAARADSAPTPGATAPVRNAAGRELGTLTLADSAQSGIRVTGRLTGLPPGEHGIHIHMVGQCQPPFESAGAHWNPTSRQHGTQNPQGPHLGDMLNITVGADSSVNVSLTTTGGSLRSANGLMDADGASIVVHTRADDYRTDPSGNSGDRIACGVVTSG
jgi:Cu-Zn family superoxide dismutase